MIEIERDGGVAVLTLARPKVNALSPELVAGLRQAVAELSADPGVGAVVLASRVERTFSAGFDLKRLHGLDEGPFGAFIEGFTALYRELFAGPVPVVAAVNGHAIAGGAILALAADRRVFGDGSGRFGLTEVDLALPLPPGVVELLRAAVGDHRAAEAALFGRLYGVAEAAAAGFADRVVPAGECLGAAVAEARALAAKPRAALRAIRELVRGSAGRAVAAADAGAGAAFRRWWTTPEATERRLAVLASLEGKG